MQRAALVQLSRALERHRELSGIPDLQVVLRDDTGYQYRYYSITSTRISTLALDCTHLLDSDRCLLTLFVSHW